MRLTLRNLGRIRDAELDLRPLTVFVGKNNTNKSWAAFAAAVLLRVQAVENEYEGATTFEPTDPEHAAIRQTIDAATESTGDSIDLRFARERVSSGSISAELGARDFAEYLKVDETLVGGLEVRLDAKARRPLFGDVGITLERTANHFRAQARFSSSSGVPLVRHAVFQDSRLAEWLSSQFATVHAERWRVVLFPVERHMLLPWSAIEGLPMELMSGHELDFLRWVGSARVGLPNRELELANELDKLLGGTVIADFDTLAFDSGGVRVPLPMAASVVRSVAGLSLYLRRLARPGDAIVIDEPEMNAHPEAQLGLVELFAMLVNRGYRVLVTTHSPYVVDHLSTLMLASRASPEARARLGPRFVLKSADAFVSPDDVAVYEFREVDAEVVPTSILDREAGVIDVSTFARQTDRISDLVNAVLDETA